MSNLSIYINTTLSVFTILAQLGIIFVAIILVLKIFKRPTKVLHHLSQKTSEHALLAGLLVSTGGLVTSLIYSNILGFVPCELCWWQRIFLYPQVIIFGVAYYNKRIRKVEDEMVFLYSLVLSICGAFIALFQYYGQMFNPDLLSACDLQGESCAKILFVSFGYITIPLMSLTAYLLIIIFYFLHRHARRNLSTF
jgi:disulfide bond formation protein DsbB